MFTKIFLFLFVLTIASSSAFAKSSQYYFVNTATLKVRVAPTTKSMHSYSIYKNYKVKVYEMKDGWARISRYKTNAVNGKFVKVAKWSYAKFLTQINEKNYTKKKQKKRAAKKKYKKKTKKVTKNTSLDKALAPSDNYDKYADIFTVASQKLIDKKECKIRDFKRMRGWVQSTPDNLYFTYCGGFRKTDKVYLNIVTGEVSRATRKK
ncbi:MAG: hypothetical protein Q9M32_08270 [Sulfurimonas sp.]|nr:hypothetical protein [Sulfurimonas sp.]MDQ7062105.1 hypothetical protein [Sulfurimonas sp.]